MLCRDRKQKQEIKTENKNKKRNISQKLERYSFLLSYDNEIMNINHSLMNTIIHS